MQMKVFAFTLLSCAITAYAAVAADTCNWVGEYNCHWLPTAALIVSQVLLLTAPLPAPVASTS